MIKANKSAMGIVFPNIFDKLVPDLTRDRLMASIPFGGRYRMIDFILSSMVNSGINNIAVPVSDNYFSLIDHIGSGREWDLARKNGGLTMFPPYAMKQIGHYGGRVQSIAGILAFLKGQKEKYVVMSDCNIAYNIDFKKVIDAHIAKGADVTVMYTKEALPEVAITSDDSSKGFYYTLDVAEDGKVTKIKINEKEEGIKNFSMNIYVIERELLIKLVDESSLLGGKVFERDVLIPKMDELNIQAYNYEGYVSRISGRTSYFNENMRLLEDENLDGLFAGNPIYTKIRDDNPTRYIAGAKSSNALVADGCVIEGEVENAILFRGVVVGKGAVVKNCILMQDTVVEAGAHVEYVITDKQVTISEGKEVIGADTLPTYIPKGKTV